LQESGRAGRDGKLSRCTMFYRREDISKVSSLIHDSNNKDVATRNLYKFVEHFCEYDGKTCRRKSVAVILGELDPENIKCNNLCDICCSGYKPKEYDATNAVVQVIKLLRLVKQNNVRENVSMIQLLELWCGNGKIWKELKHFVNDSELEILKARKKEVNGEKNNLMKIIVNMLLKGFLKEIFIANVYSWNVYVDVTDLGNIFMVEQEPMKNGSQRTFGKLDYDNCNSTFKIILDQDKKKSTSLSKRKRKDYDAGDGTGSVGSSKQNRFHSIDGTNTSSRKTIRKKNVKKKGGGVSNTGVVNLIDDDDDFRDFMM
jgi:superfamily II DNA helicase RecQ